MENKNRTKKIVTLGEIMLRLSPAPPLRFLQANGFDAVFGGSEANVAVSLAALGADAYYVTKLPGHDLGQAAVNELRKFGVKTDYILRGGERIGIYFMEYGASMRSSRVIYDRKGSAVAEARAEEFDFDKIFRGASWFHFSGITPALSSSAADLTEKALHAAKNAGITVSVDLNYRQKLWTPAQAQKQMMKFMPFVDVCIGNEEDMQKMLGFTSKALDAEKGIINLDAYREIFKRAFERFGFKYIAASLRESTSATENGWQGIIYDGKEFYVSPKYKIHLVDRLGGGDAFSAALIFSLLNGKNGERAIGFAAAASALKQTVFGDFNLTTIEEIEKIEAGNLSGRVSR